MNTTVVVIVVAIIALIIFYLWPHSKPIQRKRVIGMIKNNLLPNMCLNIEDSALDPGKFAYINKCENNASKIWEIDDKNRLINKNSGLCLEQSKSTITTDFRPYQWTCGDNPEQKWTLEEGRLVNNGKFLQTATSNFDEKGIPVVLTELSGLQNNVRRLDQVWNF